MKLSSLPSSNARRSLATVHRGLAFEERSLSVLRTDMSMSLKRVGGKADGGIDFFGWWWLPHDSPNNEPYSSVLHRRRIRVIGQCKAEKKKSGPHYVRELEGVLYRFLTQKSEQSAIFVVEEGADAPPTVAVLVSQSSFTKSSILRANSSKIPFCLLHLPQIDRSDLDSEDVDELPGKLGSVWFNPALCGPKGLVKGRVEVRWERHLEKLGGRPALWWDGVRLPSWIPEPSMIASLGIPVQQT